MVTSAQLIETRKRLGLSQAELGRHFGVNIATIWRWENEGVPSQGAASGAVAKWVADNVHVPASQPEQAA